MWANIITAITEKGMIYISVFHVFCDHFKAYIIIGIMRLFIIVVTSNTHQVSYVGERNTSSTGSRGVAIAIFFSLLCNLASTWLAYL